MIKHLKVGERKFFKTTVYVAGNMQCDLQGALVVEYISSVEFPSCLWIFKLFCVVKRIFHARYASQTVVQVSKRYSKAPALPAHNFRFIWRCYAPTCCPEICFSFCTWCLCSKVFLSRKKSLFTSIKHQGTNLQCFLFKNICLGINIAWDLFYLPINLFKTFPIQNFTGSRQTLRWL